MAVNASIQYLDGIAKPQRKPVASDPDWPREARALVDDLLQRSPLLYWVDFLLSVSAGWACIAIYFLAPAWSAEQIVAFLAAGVLFYRVGTFMHEIVHMTPEQMPWFKRAWNALFGIPLLMPWVMYRNHVVHHNAHKFGTRDDGEYLPLGASPLRETLLYMAQVPWLPLFMVARFGVIGPLSHFNRRFREWTLVHVTAATTNPYYARRLPARDERNLSICEWLCFAWLALLATLLVRGVIQWHHVGMVYLLMGYALGMNWIRNLAAHAYVNDGRTMTLAAQVEDSINVTGMSPLTVMMFPVGLRYHALHHLFPSLPYHNMGKAHRRLMERLPEHSAYRRLNRVSFLEAVGDLWRSAAETPPEHSAMRAWRSPPSGP